jgi:hypothetical protein
MFMLGMLLLSVVSFADSVTLYFYPSPHGVNWRTPKTLARSMLRNATSRLGRQIGHSSVEIICDGSDGLKPFYDFTGSSNTTNEHRNQILFRGYGLSSVFLATPGALESPSKLIPERDKRLNEGRIAFLRAEVTPAACRRAQEYLQEYRKLGYGAIYGGLMHEPRARQGAGCTAFAKSFLDVLGFLDRELTAAWTTFIRVPSQVLGGPEYGGRRVSFVGMLLNPLKYRRWAKAREVHRPLYFWDPDKMYAWVNQVARGEASAFGGRFQVASVGRSSGIVIDRTAAPLAVSSFWLRPDSQSRTQFAFFH